MLVASLGLIAGSFLTVYLSRFGTGRNLSGRSMCLSCGASLKWFNLIPLFSFLLQGGRCRKCLGKISPFYFLTEVLTTGLAVLIFWQGKNLELSGWTLAIYFFLVGEIFFFFLALTLYDLRHKIIPDTFLLFAFVGVLALSFLNFSPAGVLGEINFDKFLGAFLAPLPFLFIFLISSGRAMGFGDVKLAFVIGLFLGVSSALASLVLAVWSGALVGLILIASRKKYGLKSEIPFAPFLIFGSTLSFFLEIRLGELLFWPGLPFW